MVTQDVSGRNETLPLRMRMMCTASSMACPRDRMTEMMAVLRGFDMTFVVSPIDNSHTDKAREDRRGPHNAGPELVAVPAERMKRVGEPGVQRAVWPGSRSTSDA
jgi:hypothetical protein